MNREFEKEVKRLMATGMTEAEAKETALYDMEVEAGHKTEYDLTAEQEKASKKARGTGTRTYTFTQRERKPNEAKRWIMKQIHTLFQGIELNGKCKGVNLSNVERTLDFEVDGKQYTLTLTEHRPKK
jgi:hypothetical protein